MNKVKITVLKTAVDNEIASQYTKPGLGFAPKKRARVTEKKSSNRM